MLITLPGCLEMGVSTPFPQAVLVPHPHRFPGGASEAATEEMYTTSPNRNPDGTGVLPIVWLQSRMTLVTPFLASQREAMNSVALARTGEEQTATLSASEQFHRENLVFEGFLVGDFNFGTDPEWYLPKGLYLIDDRGNRFYPLSAKSGKPFARSHLAAFKGLGAKGSGGPRPDAKFLRIIFPGEALSENTRAVILYLAGFRRRISFTWIFDPSYQPPGPGYRPEAGSGLQRMFRISQP